MIASMGETIPNEKALAYVALHLGYRNLSRYQARANFLFCGIPLANKHVLDVGCGKGEFSAWAALHGASYTLGIEPESHGSTTGSLEVFQSLIRELGLTQTVRARNLALQDLEVESPFDIIVLYNVINHLDEEAVIALPNNPEAVRRYLAIGRHLRGLIKTGGVLILGDCGRLNLWRTLGLRFPLASGKIEWHKHQEPAVWINLLQQVGFSWRDFRWSPLYPLGRLASNRLIQYLTLSHYVIRFTAV